MDPDDGFNNDEVCHQTLSDLGGGERGRIIYTTSISVNDDEKDDLNEKE